MIFTADRAKSEAATCLDAQRFILKLAVRAAGARSVVVADNEVFQQGLLAFLGVGVRGTVRLLPPIVFRAHALEILNIIPGVVRLTMVAFVNALESANKV